MPKTCDRTPPNNGPRIVPVSVAVCIIPRLNPIFSSGAVDATIVKAAGTKPVAKPWRFKNDIFPKRRREV
jgi:hypothetical protein